MLVATEKLSDRQTVRIPDELLQKMQITVNDPVDISWERESIVIRKKGAPIHKTTKERLIEFYGEDYERKSREDYEQFRKEHGIIEWGPPLGKEIW